jgi:hypothetical protein
MHQVVLMHADVHKAPKLVTLVTTPSSNIPGQILQILYTVLGSLEFRSRVTAGFSTTENILTVEAESSVYLVEKALDAKLSPITSFMPRLMSENALHDGIGFRMHC